MSNRRDSTAEQEQAPPDAAVDLNDYVPFFLSAVGNRMSRSASQVYLDRFGVGINEWRLLANLKVRPGIAASEICLRSGIDKAAASRALTRLDALGCIAPERRGTKQRPLRLTAIGSRLHDRILVVALQRERLLMEGFSREERALLLTFLRRLYANLPRAPA